MVFPTETAPKNFGVLDNLFLPRSLGSQNQKPPLTVHESTSIQEALALLREHKIGCLVLLNDEDKIAGIFTERDVVLKVSVCDMSLPETAVSTVMTLNPHTEKMTTSMAFALNMMSQGGYRHIPIVDDDGYPVGVVSVKDIVDYIVEQLNKDLARS